MSPPLTRRRALGSIASTTLLAGCVSGIPGTGDNYPSKPITWEVPASPGGGADTYARAIAPGLSESLDVEVRPNNTPPISQMLERNWSKDEGYTISSYATAIGAAQLVENGKDSKWNAANWALIGSPIEAPFAIYFSTESDVDSWEDAVRQSQEQNRVFNFASVLPDPIIYYYLDSLTDLKVKQVTGFDGTSDMISQMERGQIHLSHFPISSAIPFVQEDIVKPILARKPIPEVAVSAYKEMGYEGVAPRPESVGLSELRNLLVQYRAIITSPDIATDRRDALRDGFWEAITSDDIQKSLRDKGRPVAPIKGSELNTKLIELADSLISVAEDVGYTDRTS